MALGPGKYNELCTYVREHSHAEAAAVIIINGDHGAGFSVQAPIRAQLVLSDMLELVARQIRADIERGKL